MSLDEHLQRVTSRFDELTHLMSESGVSGEKYAQLSKEYSDLGPLVTAINVYQEAQRQAAAAPTRGTRATQSLRREAPSCVP